MSRSDSDKSTLTLALARHDFSSLSKGDERFDAQRTETLRALAELPAYRLTYDEPRAAAALFLDLLGVPPLPEVKP